MPHAAERALNFVNAIADCRASLAFDDETRVMVWNLFLTGPQPIGCEPAVVPARKSPNSEAFAAIKLEPCRLRALPGTVLLGKGGQVLTWRLED